MDAPEPTTDDAARRAAVRVARRRLVVGGLGLAALMAVISAVGFALSPDEVILHRDLTGVPTRTGSPLVLLVFLPMVALFLTTLLVATAGSDHLGNRRTPDEITGQATIGLLAMGLVGALHLVIVVDAAQWLDQPLPLMGVVLAAFITCVGAVLRRGRVGAAGINLPLPDDPDLRRDIGIRVGDAFIAVGLVAVAVGVLGFVPAWTSWAPATSVAISVIGLAVVCIQALRVASAARRDTDQSGADR